MVEILLTLATTSRSAKVVPLPKVTRIHQPSTSLSNLRKLARKAAVQIQLSTCGLNLTAPFNRVDK